MKMLTRLSVLVLCLAFALGGAKPDGCTLSGGALGAAGGAVIGAMAGGPILGAALLGTAAGAAAGAFRTARGVTLASLLRNL